MTGKELEANSKWILNTPPIIIIIKSKYVLKKKGRNCLLIGRRNDSAIDRVLPHPRINTRMEGISSYERHNTTGCKLIPNPRGQINEEITDI